MTQALCLPIVLNICLCSHHREHRLSQGPFLVMKWCHFPQEGHLLHQWHLHIFMQLPCFLQDINLLNAWKFLCFYGFSELKITFNQIRGLTLNFNISLHLSPEDQLCNTFPSLSLQCHAVSQPDLAIWFTEFSKLLENRNSSVKPETITGKAPTLSVLSKQI